MTKKFTYSEKHAGDQLTHTEWNNLAQDVDAAVDAINNGGGGTASTVIDTNGVISVSSKGNVTVGSNKNVNIEPAWDNNTASYSGNYGDIALKSGDDIQFCSHHREPKKRDKVVVKNIDGSDNPVKLQVVAGELDLAVGTANNPKTATRKKDKTTGADTSDPLFKTDDAKVMDVRILTGETLDPDTNSEREERGYLKVRAQAIDLRCEKHGGIALQPKGYDSDGNMNKIKFEHGGGDGLEFGTFNAEKTSIFTDEYRFNREGIWKMSNRTTEASGKDIIDEREGGLQGLPATGALKYKKNTSANNSALATQTGKTYEAADDFYDFIDTSDEQCRTKDIIKTAYTMNGGKDRHTKITNKGAVEIATNVTWTIHVVEDNGSAVNINTISDEITALDSVSEGMAFNDGDFKVGSTSYTPNTTSVYTNGTQYFKFVEVAAPAIKIESGGELKLGGILDFGSSFNFGETDNGIEVQYKLTKKNSTKDCGVLKVIGINNSTTNTLTITTANPSDGTVQDYVIPAAEQVISANTYTPQTIASCSINDIIMFVNWAKGTGYGPWSSEAIAGKEELQWGGSGFAAVTPATPGENPIGE